MGTEDKRERGISVNKNQAIENIGRKKISPCQKDGERKKVDEEK